MLARFLVITASEMQSVAVGWQLYALTHRALDLGLVGLAQFLPGICLFPVAGHAADRFARNRILRVCYVGFLAVSVALLAFTLHGMQAPWPIYAALLWNGTVRAFNAPAGQAILPLLVDHEDFPNAVAWSSTIFQTATIAGPLFGGALYAVTGHPTMVYTLCAIAYSLAFAALGRVRFKPAEKVVSATGHMVLEGLRYIWRHKLVLGAISLDLFAVLLGGAVALLPVYAREILRVGAVGLGLLRAAPGVGAVLMALALAHWPLKRKAGLTMMAAILAFGLSTIAFGLSHSFVVSLIMLLLTGATDMVNVIVRQTMVQLSTPDEMRGRVSAVNMVFVGASNEVGQFESGITAHLFGTERSVVLGGIGTILVVLLWSWWFPALRRVDRLVAADLVARTTASEQQ
jgi:MFS family permease